MENNEMNHSAESTTENLPFFSDGYNKWVEKQEDDTLLVCCCGCGENSQITRDEANEWTNIDGFICHECE